MSPSKALGAALVASAFVAIAPPRVHAQATPAQKCSAAKLERVGRAAAGTLKCHAKAVKREAAVDPSCLASARARLDGALAAAEAAGGCLPGGNAAALAAYTDDVVAGLTTAISAGSTDASRACAARKLRAAGKEAKAILACRAAAAHDQALVGGTCAAKAGADFERTFLITNLGGGCATRNDADAVSTLVEEFSDRIASALVSFCGDGLTGPGEQCDGGSDANCPGECRPSCACEGSCGDAALDELAEECDDGNLFDADGCSSLCQLENRSAVCAGAGAAQGTALGVELVESDFEKPVDLTAPPLDPRRLFVVEQPGRVRVIRDGVLLETPFLDITGRVEDGGTEQGLLGLAFHPDYERNGWFFVNYTGAGGHTFISRFRRVDDDRADEGDERIVLTVEQPFANHNGGQLAFDAAGFLYVGMGDGGSGDDPQENAQDDAKLLGKLLRMNVDVPDAPYRAVPPDNPNPTAPGPLALVWAKGLRNPWRFTFDRGTDDLYIADVGQRDVEEIDYTLAPRTGGENYGWDVFEGSACFEPTPPATECPDPPDGFELPVHEYGHGEGCSITGGYVYRGCSLPDLRGTYFYSDFCTRFIRTFEIFGGAAANHADRTAELVGSGFIAGNVSSFGQDARGEIYILNHDGRVWKIVPGAA